MKKNWDRKSHVRLPLNKTISLRIELFIFFVLFLL
jgi:hypothetical protein